MKQKNLTVVGPSTSVPSPGVSVLSNRVTCYGGVGLRAEFSFRDLFSDVLDEMMLDEISLFVTGLHSP